MEGLSPQTDAASDAEPEVNQPGLRELREAVANHLGRRLPSRASLREDGMAGLNSAISSVPDGMASGILVGVNPIYGLYSCMVGPIAGGIFSSTRLMVIATTSAASLSAGQALGGLQAEARDNALFLMVVLIGALTGFVRSGADGTVDALCLLLGDDRLYHRYRGADDTKPTPYHLRL